MSKNKLFTFFIWASCNIYYINHIHTIAPFRYITVNGWVYYVA